ncbi:hypothetical protein [Paraburkholderia adhaesiva]|uniref:hypothetical protein n=1 Tax=Paraburkholderia adhaesiva TaxID=2883244 RepID=UPI001F28507D|nr:hypothetical protein [Paraburkholderia adhaesiva]
MTAALAHARSLRRVISASAQQIFSARIASNLLHAIQRDVRGEQEDTDQNVTLNVLDRVSMTAAGLRVALRTIDDPALRILMELRLPRPVAQCMGNIGVCDMRVETAHDLLDAAYALAGGEAC